VYYVYILQLKNSDYYIGFSSDLKLRFAAHQKGDVAQTRKQRPLKLVYYSAFSSKLKAIKFELYLKTGSGFAFRNKHFI
jgi:putative endonuclease